MNIAEPMQWQLWIAKLACLPGWRWSPHFACKHCEEDIEQIPGAWFHSDSGSAYCGSR